MKKDLREVYLAPNRVSAELAINVFAADSDQFARLFRSYLARDSETISPTVPISNRPEARSFLHVDFLASVTVVGQPS